MEPGIIQYIGTKGCGGYGDRLIGMVSVLTIANMLGFDFKYTFEEDFMKNCLKSDKTTTKEADISIWLINQDSSQILQEENLPTIWSKKTVTIHANITIHGLLWKNKHLNEILKNRDFDIETTRSFQELFSKYIQFSNPFPVIQYDCGLQIRVGDTYCHTLSNSVSYIPTEQFAVLAQRMKSYLQNRGIKGSIYVTCDTFHIYKHFTALNDSDYTFVFRDRSDDIHFDSHNSNNRYKEILEDHCSLMNCKRVITGLRSNFGTTATYCSPICSEIVFYSSTWEDPCTIEFKAFNPKTTLVLKTYKKHYNDATQCSTILVSK